MAMQKALLDAGAAVDVVGTHLGTLVAADGQEISAPKSVLTDASVMYDAVYVPGGADGAAALQANADAIHFVQEAFKHYKPIAANGAGADVLTTAAVNADDPGIVVAQDGAAQAGSVIDAFLAAIGKHRFWDRTRAGVMPA